MEFKDYYNKRLQEEFYKKNNRLLKAYSIGAFSRAIVNASFKKNDNKSFKNWLDNVKITYDSLYKIYEKGCEFENKLNLFVNQKLHELIHSINDFGEPNVSKDKINYAFRGGYSDYEQFSIEKNEEKKNKQNNEEVIDETE